MGICGEDSQMASFLAHTSFFQLCGFLLACIGWCLCVSATSIEQWRQWHIQKSTTFPTGMVWIGIWDVCYDSNTETDFDEMVCKSFEAEQRFVPKEIFIAQDLMSLCTIMHSLALGFFFIAYWNIIKDEGNRKISLTFFTIGGFLSLTSGIVVLIPVTWNMLSVLNNNNIDFPESFGIPSPPQYQKIGVAIPLGFVSAILLLMSGLIFLDNRCLLINKKTHPLDPEEGSKFLNRKDSVSCPHCASSLNVAYSSHYKSFCEDCRVKKKQSKSEEAFQIPMGPIPEQRIAH